MKWTPKNDTVGVPGEGLIAAKDFKKEHLRKLIDRANNRNLSVALFLSQSLRQATDEEEGIDDKDLLEVSELESEVAKDEAKKKAKEDAKKKA